jgi:hypothetical protein
VEFSFYVTCHGFHGDSVLFVVSLLFNFLGIGFGVKAVERAGGWIGGRKKGGASH